MRVIATETNEDLGLVDEKEFISTDEDLKQVYIMFGVVKPREGGTNSITPKGFVKYVEESFPPERFVLRNAVFYESNCQTSETWVNEEWDNIQV